MPSSSIKRFGHRAVRSGTLDREGTTVAEAESTVQPELVALGVSPEIIVIIEDQNAGFVAGSLAIKMRCRKAADSASDNN